MKRHEHDWHVLDLCRDYCRICTRLRRACPVGHRHVASVAHLATAKEATDG